MKKIAFCSECGTQYAELTWPRSCQQCGNMEWNNPKPVVVVLQPVRLEGAWPKLGLAVGQRAIQPGLGKWALISGYSDDCDDSLEAAARREFWEETGLAIEGSISIAYSKNSHNNNMLAFCVVDTPMNMSVWRSAKCCPENSRLDVLFDPEGFEMAFPLHEEAIRNWFERKI